MWNLVKLSGYGKSAKVATRFKPGKPVRNGRARIRVARCRGFEQLESRALMSAVPGWPAYVPHWGPVPALAPAAKAAPKINVVDHGGTYNGSAFPATVTVTGTKGPAAASLEGVSPTLSYCLGNSCSSTPPSQPGTYTVVATFSGSADYAAAKSAPLTFTIAKAIPTIQVADAGGAYTGLPFPATVTVTGGNRLAASLEGVSPTLSYCLGNSCSSTPPTQPGTYTVVATFPGSADYAAAKSAPLTFTITTAIVTVTSANFQQQVLESSVPVLVDFSATWCEWCQKEAPVLQQLAQDRTDIKVVEIDYDANPSLVQQFNVNAIPRLFLFESGQKVADTLGYQTESQLLAMLDQTTTAGLVSTDARAHGGGWSVVMAPTAPSFTAAAVSSSQINLAWSGVSGATGYLVDAWVDGQWKQIGRFASGIASDAVTGLNAGTTYYFDVAAYNSVGTTWANYRSATTRATLVPPAAPSLTATAVSASQINLTWTTASGATGYLVDEWVNGQWKQIGSVANGITSDAVTGLSAGTTYYFEVAATNSAGTTWANLQSATTTAAVNVNEPAAATAYSPVSGTLFSSNGPSYLDVQQGYVGDCWLLASLAEVAARDPQDIRSMFTADGTTVENGSTVNLYTVRFFNSAGVAEYVTVDTELPSGGNYYDQPANGVLWVALAEKAYAEANGAGFVTTSSEGSDSYNALNCGCPSWALEAITGKSSSDFSIDPSNIAAAWGAGQLIVLGSNGAPANSEIVGDHAYAVVGYTASSSNPFQVYNPWGINTAAADGVYGLFSANAITLSQNFDFQSVGSGSAVELQTAAQRRSETPADIVLAGWDT